MMKIPNTPADKMEFLMSCTDYCARGETEEMFKVFSQGIGFDDFQNANNEYACDSYSYILSTEMEGRAPDYPGFKTISIFSSPWYKSLLACHHCKFYKGPYPRLSDE